MNQTLIKILVVTFSVFIGQQIVGQEIQLTDYSLELKKGEQETIDGKINYAVKVTLKNNSSDTLKYFSKSCSWQELYFVSTEKLTVQQSPCAKNLTIIASLPPNGSKTVKLYLTLDPMSDSPEIRFKVGFNLVRASESENIFDYDKKQKLNEHIIWSNRITMK